MSRLARASAAAMILAGSIFLLAQAQNPTGDPRPLTPGGADNPSIKDQKSAPTNPPKAAPNTEGTGSRPIGPPGNETPGAGRHQGHQGRRQEEPAVARNSLPYMFAATLGCALCSVFSAAKVASLDLPSTAPV